jgi:uncharacterized membrane protein
MRLNATGIPRELLGTLFRYLPRDLVVSWILPDGLRGVLVSGTAATLPFIVTFVVLGVVIDFVSNLLTPFVQALALVGLTAGLDPVVAQLLTAVALLGTVLVVGVVAEAGPETGIGRRAGDAVESIPGVGSVYNSFDRMSEVMLDDDSTSFQEVKLVEFPHSDLYSLAFQTASVPDATPPGGDQEGMVVLFVPLAPNPVMGGFMVCVADEQVSEIDMTVEEAFRAIVTSGVAMPEDPTV